MSTKTYPQLVAQTDVEDTDLIASFRTVGPLKKLRASVLRAYMRDEIPGTDSTFLQAGTGASQQTMQGKARQWIAVEDFYQSTSDDSTAIQRAYDRIHTLGFGSVIFSPQTYSLSFMPILDASALLGQIHIAGRGARLIPVGAAGGMKVLGRTGQTNIEISQLMVDQHLNAAAEFAFLQEGTGNVTWRGCFVLADSGVTADYAGWWLRNTDPADDDTGCFWNAWPGSSVESNGGAVPYGVWLDGPCNASDFHGFKALGVNNPIRMTQGSRVGSSVATANCVRVLGADLETGTNAVLYDVPAGEQGPFGLVIDSRIEGFDYILGIAGADVDGAMPSTVVARQSLQSVLDVVDNPGGLKINVHDFRTGAASPATSSVVTQAGWRYVGTDAAFHALRVAPANVNSGFVIDYAGGAPDVVGFIAQQIAGSQFELGTSHATTGLDLKIRNLKGISQTDTHANNLDGSATFLTAATVVVVFAVDEPDTNYKIGGSANANETFWWSNKTIHGFTMHSSNVASAATYDWHLLR